MPCNNDLLAGNFVDDGEQVWLIDYEYSGNNDACFELGNTCTECDLDDDQVEALVAAYVGTADAEPTLARARLQALVSAYGWSLWGAIQAAASELDFDFDAWGLRAVREGGPRVHLAGLRHPAGGGRRVPTDLPSRARVVVVGGGVIGTSTAYHLTRLGWTDVLLLEQGHLSCGTTWHAAGLVGQLRASESGTRLVQYSGELYAQLEAETGLSAGYQQCGGVIVARTPDRMTQLRRTAATADAYGLECAMLTPDEAARALAADAGRRPARRDLAARRRHGQPDRPDHGAGQGRPAARRPRRRAAPGCSTCSPATAP